MNTDFPWKRYISEGAVIVLSILLAFGMDAWWDRWQEEIYQDELLSRIESALGENIRLIDSRIEDASKIEEPIYSFFEMDSENLADISNFRARFIIDTLIKPYTSTFNNDNLISLFGNVNSTLALNSDLQDNFAVWRKEMNSSAVMREQLLWVEREIVRALGNSPEVRPFMGSYSIENFELDAGNAAIKSALGNAEVMSLANAKLMYLGVYTITLNRLKLQSESLQLNVSSLTK